MRRGFVYLVAVLDWASRRVLAWQLSNSLTADFCVEALESAKRRYGTPEIVNTDQGSQFTSEEFVSAVLGSGAQLRMDGKGAWSDKLFIERFWRTVKYEEVYLRAYETSAMRVGTSNGTWRFTTVGAAHSSLVSERRIPCTSTRQRWQHEHWVVDAIERAASYGPRSIYR